MQKNKWFIKVVEELRKDVKEQKVTIEVNNLEVKSCEVKEVKTSGEKEVMNNKRDAKGLQAGAKTKKKKKEAKSRSGN